jgi:hypothetical protein
MNRIEKNKEYAEGKLKKHTILVYGSSSSCGYCEQDCDPSLKTHEMVTGYGEHTLGCGIDFRYIASMYSHVTDVAKRMNREDLEQITFNDLSKPL